MQHSEGCGEDGRSAAQRPAHRGSVSVRSVMSYPWTLCLGDTGPSKGTFQQNFVNVMIF